MINKVIKNDGNIIIVDSHPKARFIEIVERANQYDKEAHELEKERQNKAALEKRLIAAENFMNIGFFNKAAGSYGNAGLDASFLHDNGRAVEYKLYSAMLHFAIGNYEDAAYSLAYASMIFHSLREERLRDETARLSDEFFKRANTMPKKESIKAYLERFNFQQQP